MNRNRICGSWLLLTSLLLVAGGGCAFHGTVSSPTRAGYNTRDLVDPPAQDEATDLVKRADLGQMSDYLRAAVGDLVRRETPEALTRKPRHALCLSGGGSYGAFSAGIMYGWTRTGKRPEFDVVTGISTGSLIAPLAFLGPEYDEDMRRYYTQVENRDIYRPQPIRGLCEGGLANTWPLEELVDGVLTPELIGRIAEEHARGRRLYVGTTELEGRRLIIWDVGAIAQSGDRDLIKEVLLASSAISGLFPPRRIGVTVDGQHFEELHGDGAVIASVFFKSPWLPPEERSELTAANLYGTQVWCVEAAKLYSDPRAFKPRVLPVASNSLSGSKFAKSRGDINQIYTMCLLNGMSFRLTSIPVEFPTPKPNTEFDRVQMGAMFDLGVNMMCTGVAWRDMPPGCEPGETDLARNGRALTPMSRGPQFQSGGGSDVPLPMIIGPLPIPGILGKLMQ